MKLNLQILVTLGLLFLLSSCSHHVARSDGPPNFYVDETRIPNATPKYEPRAKYGNMVSYVARGKRYYPMKSSQYYEAVGVASWYGTKFHARRTSSGERYNMLAMTAAHKTLPLPTYVEVTNLRNKRKIVVKVNDRGPFEANRLIDLSYVAAKKLGMLGHGTALVRVRAIDPYNQHNQPRGFFAWRRAKLLPPPPLQSKTHHVAVRALSSPSNHEPFFSSSTHSSTIYLQVGAFRSKLRAERLQRHLITLLTVPVRISHPSVGGKLYRVQVGPFKDTLTATRIGHQLKRLGIKSNRFYRV